MSVNSSMSLDEIKRIVNEKKREIKKDYKELKEKEKLIEEYKKLTQIGEKLKKGIHVVKKPKQKPKKVVFSEPIPIKKKPKMVFLLI